MPQTEKTAQLEMARRRARYLTGVLWHLGAFAIICTFFLLLDFIGDRAINWAFWIIGAWGFALAFHVLAYLIAGSNLAERKTQQYLQEAERK
ncbi:2TM domain-containing protein [Marimonas sp. MJW-29]|uniref:2TM domain-containing protein n=1 Tax=Sulfitobacter sediminis TaxID=3234186 RepID=A0ABV3RK18_9RHOB